MNKLCYLFLSLLAFLLLQASAPDDTGFTRIGAIVDQTSRPGKEVKVAVEIAIQDSNIRSDHASVLYLQNSRSKPVHTALAAKELIDKHKVKAIVGAHTWEEASAIAEVIGEVDHGEELPLFLSLADTIPPQATHQWPFFIQAVPTQSIQMNAVAAILDSWGMHQVTLIYEASHSFASSSTSVISSLSQAFRQTGCELTHILPLTPASCLLDEELELLKKQNRKVFVIHTSMEFGIGLFQTAKRMEMTGDGYLWIATNGITDLVHSVNSSMIASLKGMVGVKSYFPKNTPEFQDFRKRFRLKFRSEYPEEEQDEPGIFAVQGYNAVKLLDDKSPEKLDHRSISPASTVEIVNGYQSGYWRKGLGFSENADDDSHGATTYHHSMDHLGEILWPAQPWYTDRRRRKLAGSSESRMRVGVPGRSLFRQFVKVEVDSESNETSISGFVPAVFGEMMKEMNISSYDYIPFYGSYDELVQQIPAQNFDAIAGDLTIVARRHEFADFTQPYTESGLEMIVPIRPQLSNRVWLFLRPFTKEMWAFIAAITLYNGFIVWLIERQHCDDLRGSIPTQIGIIFWLSFTTLFTLRGDKLHSNLSRMAVVVWLFLALIITQSYTASLASMLTAERLEPTITSVEALRNMNATVGYCNGSFINYYLREVLQFDNFKINSYNSTQGYAEALNSGEIAAIFLEVPAAKVFLAQYCNSFIRTGETFKVGGFGFAFPREFPMLSDVNKALMSVSESGKLKELEDTYLVSEKCLDQDASFDEDAPLSPNSFWVLFGLSGGTSTVSLIIYVIIWIKNSQINIFKMISELLKRGRRLMRRSSSVVVHAESPMYTPNASNRWPDQDDQIIELDEIQDERR